MQYSKEIYRKVFEDEVSKQAYLSCCKWLAKNVYGSQSYSERIAVKIQKLENRVKKVKIKKKETEKTFYRFQITLFYTVTLDESKDHFCNNCKVMTNSFLSSTPNCQECRLNAFWKKLKYEIDDISKFMEQEFKEDEQWEEA